MRRFGWTSGVGGALVLVAFAGLAFALFQNRADETQDGLADGTEMPPFAAPLVRSDLDGDANYATEADEGGPGNKPACDVRGPKILNSCALAERGPVVVAFVARVGECMDQLRALQELQDDRKDLQVAAVAIKGDRDDLRADLDRLGIRIPVGWDRDGALSNVYNVIVCPQTTFTDQGGMVRATTFGMTGLAELRRRTDRLQAAP
ncbi:MAG: redoxin domain-containing protein [Solirubrobacteraceae bacterium]|nr:redoxin domain-containing protein [Solirubrobacteraceae bacterium]